MKRGGAKRTILISVAALFLVCVLCIGGTFARYRYQSDSENPVVTDPFYFTVNLLGNTNTNADCIGEWEVYGGDAKEIPFVVQNYFDDLRKSPSGTTYSIEVTADNGYTGASISHTGGTLAAGKTEQAVNLILDDTYPNETTVTVKISSTAPYTKDMYLIFKLYTAPADVVYRVEDSESSPYATLIVTSYVDLPVGKLIVDWSQINSSGNIFQVDMTNAYVNLGSGYKFTNNLSVAINNTFEVKFFKTGSAVGKNYSVAETGLLKNTVTDKWEITLPSP
jgi:hypothetical protein